jgi:Glycosyl hydrolase family 79 C-terminal beta domain/Glycosyl hydrolase family 79, N-terminal domain
MNKKLFIAISSGLCLLTATLFAAEPSVTLTLDLKKAGASVPPDFSGLSFEAALLLPAANGEHYFRSDNLPLIHLFHTLGIKSLRIGGNTSDRDAKRLPDDADLDSLFAFARAANVKVIYCLRLHNGNPQADAATAKYIMTHYADEMDCFSIGQEPSAYPRPYSYFNYRKDWKKFADVIIAAVPDVKFCGPSVHNNAGWARRFITDFGRSNHVALITEHLYAGGSGNKVKTPEIGRDRMLSDEFTRKYQRLHDGFVPMALSNGLPYRLEEVNNYFNGGAKDVSNTFASALWGLDFMWWWAEHGAAGLNFHTGDRVAAGYALRPSKYTAFFSTTNGYIVRPLGYGIKAFDIGSHGRLIPTTLSNPENINLSAYAVLGDNKNLYLTLINKQHDSSSQNVQVKVVLRDANGSFTHEQAMYLNAPGNNVAATSGVTIGGAKIQRDGSWRGNWSQLDSSAVKNPTNDVFLTKIPDASAAIIQLSPD